MAKTAQSSKKSSGKVDMKSAMANVKKFWKKAKTAAIEAPDSGIQEYEDGRYLARLMSASICKSGSGRTQVDFDWKFVDGEYAGKHKHNYQGIENEKNIEFLLLDLKRLGFDIDELDDDELPELLAGIGKAKPHLLARIALKTKNDFQNVYINELLEDDDEEAEEAEDGEDEEENDDDTKARAKKAKAATKGKKQADDDDEDDDDSDDAEEEDDDEEEEEEKPAKKSKAKKPAEDEDEDEDDEEEEKPKSRKGKKVVEDGESEDDDEDDDEDGESEDDEDEELHISVGSEVIVQTKDGKKQAEIVEMFPDEQKIRVKTEDGKTLRLPVDRVLSLVEKTTKKAKKKR